MHSICARRRQQKVPRDNIQPRCCTAGERFIFSMHAEEQGRASSFYGNNFYTLLSSESVYNVVYRCATFLCFMENIQVARELMFDRNQLVGCLGLYSLGGGQMLI